MSPIPVEAGEMPSLSALKKKELTFNKGTARGRGKEDSRGICIRRKETGLIGFRITYRSHAVLPSGPSYDTSHGGGKRRGVRKAQ